MFTNNSPTKSRIRIEVDGKTFDQFNEATVNRDLETLCSSFSFVAFNDENAEWDLSLGKECKITVDGQLFLTGYIEKAEIKVKDGQHFIIISGRDKTCDIVDSSLGNYPTFQPNSTLKQLIEGIIKALGITDIKVIDQTGGVSFKKSIQTAEYGKPCYEFIEKYASRLGALIYTNKDSDIIIHKTTTSDLYKTIIEMKKNNRNPTVLGSNISYDNSKRFYLYEGMTQANLSSGFFEEKLKEALTGKKTTPTPQQVTNISAKAVDPEIRKTRIFVKLAQNVDADQENIKNSVIWEANYRRSQSRIFQYSLYDFIARDDNKLWDVNKLVHVVDRYAGYTSRSILNTTLLISRVQFDWSMEGAITTLSLAQKDAFTLKVNKPQKDKNAENDGVPFFLEAAKQEGLI